MQHGYVGAGRIELLRSLIGPLLHMLMTRMVGFVDDIKQALEAPRWPVRVMP